MMKITIGRHSWVAIHAWIENGRFCWLSSGNRRHSRKIALQTKIIIQP